MFMILLSMAHSPGPLAQGWLCPQWAGPTISIINQEDAPRHALRAI